MMLPGYGRLARFYSEIAGSTNLKSFKDNIVKIIQNLPQAEMVQLHLVSFSGRKSFYDQLFSSLSFYYNVGLPKSWTIYSDKTYTVEQIGILESIPQVKVKSWDKNLSKRYNVLDEFGKTSIFGNRLHAYLNHQVEEVTVFTDSDIIFYDGFKGFQKHIASKNWYIADTGPHFDKYYKDNFELSPPYVNAGFLIFAEMPKWELAIDYIGKRKINLFESWEHFTEQASIHKMVTSEDNACPLPEDKFILSCSDSFKFCLDFNIAEIALRHFVSPVRHKMWQTAWQKVLNK